MTENFIYQAYLSDISICDKLINYHKNSDKKEVGKVSGIDTFEKEDFSVKKSTDVKISEMNDVVKVYFDLLQEVLNQYTNKFKMCNEQSAFTIIEPLNIQHYLPNEGFYKWHCERGNSKFPVSSRHLVFMTYLNDVNDGGETEFYYQKLKIKPKKGLTLIWPADWTYTHRGITSLTQEKYITTGWLSFIG
jgi:hypothetical protein